MTARRPGRRPGSREELARRLVRVGLALVGSSVVAVCASSTSSDGAWYGSASAWLALAVASVAVWGGWVWAGGTWPGRGRRAPGSGPVPERDRGAAARRGKGRPARAAATGRMAGVAGVVATVEPTGLGFVLVVAGTPPGQPVRLVRVTPREDAVNARPEPGQAVVVVGHEAGGAIEAVAVGVRRDPRVGSEIVE